MSCGHITNGLSYYRDALDHQSETQMTWHPYTEMILELLLDIRRSDRYVWRSLTPLICFEIVKYHRPDRVLRQFGFEQTIPVQCDTSVALHCVDRRGNNKNFEALYRSHVAWHRRETTAVLDTPFTSYCESLHEYMAWYCRITRLFIATPLHSLSTVFLRHYFVTCIS